MDWVSLDIVKYIRHEPVHRLWCGGAVQTRERKMSYNAVENTGLFSEL